MFASFPFFFQRPRGPGEAIRIDVPMARYSLNAVFPADTSAYSMTLPVPIISKRMVVDLTSYALTGQIPVVTRVALTVTPEAFLISTTPSGNMTVTITSPGPYVGTFTVDQSAEGAAANLNSTTLLTAPQCLVKPAVTGTAIVGSTLTTVSDLWIYDAEDAPSQTGQWRRDGVAISGATSQNYTLVAADAGKTITYLGTLTGAGTTRTAVSNNVSVAGGASVAVPATAYTLTGVAPLVNVGTWSVTAGDASATIVAFPPVPTTPAWSVTAGSASATVNTYPGGA
jgi:hypothetical protein